MRRLLAQQEDYQPAVLVAASRLKTTVTHTEAQRRTYLCASV
ncbi:MAG: hypothetical protein AVDCRST_MAG68-1888 [uncultured Gemmatimonadetes bacterium]|uniref:Uncharacterized protein n=1 Tax=uncultured Gemmatimonadota bacterium TaxID=203437 RepID=A0A6J4L1Q7_9BACT|nr:MAG: hypothetical protein AVDCRST_MAG68-1888 [uncultured Gemmatimonadota bacterium]